MTTDSPDWYTRTEAATLRATSIQGGLDADKSASPVAEDVYLARDTGILYVCFTSGTWTNIGTLYLLKAGGTMSGAIAMGSNKITGLAAPTADADAARKSEIDSVSALLDDVSVAEPSRAFDTEYQNTGGKIRVVVVSAGVKIVTKLETIDAYIGSTSPPGTRVARLSYYVSALPSANYWIGNMTFIVPPNWYYKVKQENATMNLQEWIEYDLL